MTKKLIIKVVFWTVGVIVSIVVVFSVSLYIFKDNIVEAILQRANEQLKTKVIIEKVDIAFWSSFPNLSIDFHNVFIQDSYEESTEKDTLFYSEKIRFRFNPIDLYKENYRLKRVDIFPGTLHIKIDSLGGTNYNIFYPSTDSTSTAIDFDLQRITVKQLLFSFTDQMSNYRYESIFHTTELKGDFTQQIFTLRATSSLYVNELTKGKIKMLSEKDVQINLNLNIDQKEKTINIPTTTIQISELPFEIMGVVSPNYYSVSVKSKKIKLNDLVNNFTLDEVQTIAHYKGKGLVEFALLVENEDNKTTIDCFFGVNNGELYEPTQKIQLSNIQLNGHYSNINEVDIVEITNLKFKTETGVFIGNITISDFNQPILIGNAHGRVNLFVAHQLFNFPKIKQIDGEVTIDANFHLQLLSEKTVDIHNCRGYVVFDDNSLQLIDYNRQIDFLNGQIDLQDNQIYFKNISAKIENSDLHIDGVLSNTARYLKRDKKNVANLHFSGSLTSNLIELENVFPITNGEISIESTSETYFLEHLPNLPLIINGELQISIKKINLKEDRIDNFVANIHLNHGVLSTKQFSITELRYEKHLFNDIQGTFLLDTNSLTVKKLKLKTSDAFIDGNVNLSQMSSGNFIVSGQLLSHDMPIKNVLEDWNNFSQDIIKSSNVNGTIDANVRFNIPVQSNKGIVLTEMQMDMQLKLKNGHLKNVEMFQEIIKNINTTATKIVIGESNIKHFASKLEGIKFETIENTIKINKGIIHIPQMDIRSTALNISLSGQHSFDNKIDYKFAFRLRDIKEKKVSEFGDIINDNMGIIVYLRMYGTTEKPKFEWNKEEQKKSRRQYNEQEKQTLKNILKSEFGVFKNDSSVHEYREKPKKRELIQIDQNHDTNQTPQQTEKTTEKKGKIRKVLDKIETEKKEQKKIEVEWE